MAVGGKDAFVVFAALLDDPLTEPVAIDRVGPGDAGVTLALDKLFQQPEPELPGGGGLLDEAHIESAGEIDADPCGQVEVDLAGEP